MGFLLLNHSTVQVCPSPTPLLKAGSFSAMSCWVLSITKDRHITTSTDNPFQCWTALMFRKGKTQGKAFSVCKMESLYFSLCPLPLVCSVITPESGSVLWLWQQRCFDYKATMLKGNTLPN